MNNSKIFVVTLTMAAIVLLSLTATKTFGAKNIVGKVTSVLDGDTLKIGDKKIRFVTADAPELDSGRSTATDAKTFLKTACLNKNAIVDVNDPRPKDTSGRYLGLIYCNGSTESMEQLELEQDYAVLWHKYACDQVNNEFYNQTWIQCPGKP